MMESSLRNVDHSAIRTNQALIIALLIIAFVVNFPWLVLIVSVIMLVGSIFRRPGFGILYSQAFRPLGLLKPDVVPDNPEPHLFAQAMGGSVLLAAWLLLFFGVAAAGWALAWLVVALAALNLFAGFCAGCAIYYWLNRLGIPGFIKSPPLGPFPGRRPGSSRHA